MDPKHVVEFASELNPRRRQDDDVITDRREIADGVRRQQHRGAVIGNGLKQDLH
jgi:hypothetical protein